MVCGKVITCSGLKLYLVSPTKVKTLDRSEGDMLSAEPDWR